MGSVTKVDAVVIGAGVLGIAVARALSCPTTATAAGSAPPRRKKREVLLLEKNSAIGMETSSRNSQVVHAGLYYPSNSSKARWCVEGRRRLYRYCREKSVFTNMCGKLVVATTDGQASKVRALHEQALQNGAHDVQLIGREQVLEMEPQLTTTLSALWSPSTGIVNAHELMQHLLTDAEEEGNATLVLNSEIKEARISDEGRVLLRVPPDDNTEKNASDDSDEMWLDCNVVVNAAGLWADEVARAIHGGGATSSGRSGAWQPPRQYFCKGTYFGLEGGLGRHPPFSRLVYPVPDPAGGLGVHATLDEGRQIKFGPDVEWLPTNEDAHTLSYVPDENRALAFYESIRRYWPGLPPDSLVPGYCGVRPKLSHPNLPGPAFHDFCVAGPSDHSVKGLVHLFGMESPGLTSALAVAEHVANLLEEA